MDIPKQQYGVGDIVKLRIDDDYYSPNRNYGHQVYVKELGYSIEQNFTISWIQHPKNMGQFFDYLHFKNVEKDGLREDYFILVMTAADVRRNKIKRILEEL